MMNLESISQRFRWLRGMPKAANKHTNLRISTTECDTKSHLLAAVFVTSSWLYFETETDICQWAHDKLCQKYPEIEIAFDAKLHVIFGQKAERKKQHSNMLELLISVLQKSAISLPEYQIRWFEIVDRDDSTVLCVAALQE